jgi:hypothetical protein
MLGEDGLLELGVYSKVSGPGPAAGRAAHSTKKKFHEIMRWLDDRSGDLTSP